MKKTLLLIISIFAISISVKAQDGNSGLQISGQGNMPINDLKKVVKFGYGGSVKGMYGFSDINQQVTLEAGYNRFSVKDLPSGIQGNYSSIPIYTGYRYSFGGLHLEPQAGISINKVAASAGSSNASRTSTNFGWATGISYSFSDLEIGVRYQSSDTKTDGESITFIGFKLGYNISF